jgi:hypothetical protein
LLPVEAGLFGALAPKGKLRSNLGFAMSHLPFVSAL